MSALKAKRGELAGVINALHGQLRERMVEIDHVDCTLRIFDPDIDLDAIRVRPLPPRHYAARGQVTREILSMLRRDGTLDAKAITLRLMAERELQIVDKVLCKAMLKRTEAALRNARDRGLVTSLAGRPLRWQLSRKGRCQTQWAGGGTGIWYKTDTEADRGQGGALIERHKGGFITRWKARYALTPPAGARA